MLKALDPVSPGPAPLVLRETLGPTKREQVGRHGLQCQGFGPLKPKLLGIDWSLGEPRQRGLPDTCDPTIDSGQDNTLILPLTGNDHIEDHRTAASTVDLRVFLRRPMGPVPA